MNKFDVLCQVMTAKNQQVSDVIVNFTRHNRTNLWQVWYERLLWKQSF